MRLKRILFVPDTHAPYHDKKAFALMLKAARKFKPDVVVVQGDFADFYAVSGHDKDPRRAQNLDYEVGVVKERLRELTALNPERKIYVCGNHEDRLERYLIQRAPALFGTVKVPEVLGLRESFWEFVPYKRSLKLGKLNLTHDTGTAGQNAHRQAMDTFQGSVTIGHTHRMEYTVKGRAEGAGQVGAMFGWLGDFDSIDYMHRMQAKRNWVHGFGIGFMEPNGVVHLQPIPIVNGKCVVQGELIQ